jgi:hypothetical protein
VGYCVFLPLSSGTGPICLTPSLLRASFSTMVLAFTASYEVKEEIKQDVWGDLLHVSDVANNVERFCGIRGEYPSVFVC